MSIPIDFRPNSCAPSGSAGAAERIEHDTAKRARCENGNFAQIGGIRHKMSLAGLRIFRQDVLYVTGFAAVGVIDQNIETTLLQFARSPGDFR